MIKKHKVFISYYHKEDQQFKEDLLKVNDYYNVFEDYSVGDGEIDEDLSDEQIRRKIRDKFMKEATVMILLCSDKTKDRKHIDWEIHTAMYHTDVNAKMGILVINLPGSKNNRHVKGQEEKSQINTNVQWVAVEKYELDYPELPSRILENLKKGIDISVINWEDVIHNPSKLKMFVDYAFKKRKDQNYDHSAPLRRRNN